MKTVSLLLSLVFAIPGCSPGDEQIKNSLAKPAAEIQTAKADSIAVTKVVKDFFAAFDARDTAALRKIMIPETRITHHNGAITNSQEMITVINQAKNWWPRQRELSDFEFMSADSIAVLEFSNEVIFQLPQNRSVAEPYRETWIFKRRNNDWQPVRVHYSKVSVAKHSEEVS